MKDFERTTYTFIVKIWLEETVTDTGYAVWRGHIEHIPDGERRYLRNLDDLIFFIMPYLKAMGVRFGWRERIQRLLNIVRFYSSF